MRRLLLRADASSTIGVGHVSRMVAFAERARRRDWPVAFSGTLEGADWFAARLDELDVTVVDPTDPGDDDALPDLVRKLGSDVVVVDHYDIGEVRSAVNAAGAALVSLEGGEFGRREADVVVDSGLHSRPRPDDGSGVVLRGPRYAPLREQIRHARRLRAERSAVRPGQPPEVVVVLGGGAVWREQVTRLAYRLRDTGLPFDADIVAHGDPDVPPPGPGQRFTVSKPDTRLPERLATADLAVSAAGVTLLEACCIGVPTALVLLVDNQEAGYRAAVEQGFAVGLGRAGALDDATETATETLARLLGDPARRERLASAAADVVDGLGADRVLEAVPAG
ncbi:spore coat protein [Saccharomonospora viridis]|uniref:spore coat protein n=1 Tax=Saccharomonospora viridis TaxID=1852 RepID=UPI0023F241FF|nr:spore coat protein [Saccharomonospora viridis]